MTGSLRPWWMRTGGPRRLSRSGVPALDGRHEAAQGEDRRRRRAALAEPDRVGHHRAHRETTEHGPLPADAARAKQLVAEAGQRLVGVANVSRSGKPTRSHRVPVPAAGRHRHVALRRDVSGVERGARRDAEKAPLGVERVEQAVEVALVGAAAVVEDQRPGGLAGRLADEVVRRHARERVARVRRPGAASARPRSRRCSKSGGSESFSPRSRAARRR